VSLRARVAALFGRPPRARSGDEEELPPDPAAQREFLTRSLDEHLEETAREKGFGAAGRAVWLAEHLELYVGRCVGFASLPQVGAASVRESQGFVVVEVGAAALRRELDAAPPAPAAAAAWDEFLRRLEATRQGAGFEPLAAAAGELRAALGGTDPYAGKRDA
jgi:O-methyltransferase involved in polyketide biosynthesis